MRIAFAGSEGRMGKALVPALHAESSVELVAEIEAGDDLAARLASSKAQVLVDFTTPTAARANAEAALRASVHVVMGTTGLTPEDRSALDSLATSKERAILVAPNFALGMILIQQCAERIAAHFPDVEVRERHHPGKLDAPSGTARRTAEQLAAKGAKSRETASGDTARGVRVDGIRILSERLPGIHARQSITFASEHEGLELTHEAYSRLCYLPGILLAVRSLEGRTGLLYGLEQLL